MKRAFAVLQIKEATDGVERVIRGIATSPRPDRLGDVIEPAGVRVAADIPLFLHHDSKQTVGRARLLKATANGIPFEARLPNVKEAGTLRDRVDEAWQMVKYGLITGVSIGFNVVNNAIETIKDGGYRFLETEVLELSLVPIPAQPDAVIQGFKSLDRAAVDTLYEALRAASGNKQGSISPGASGKQQIFLKGKQMQTLQEVREVRAAKANRMKELIELMKQPEYQTSEDENAEFDMLGQEVKTLDVDIRVKQFEAMQAAAATPAKGKSSEEGRVSRAGISFVRRADPEPRYKGEAFTRTLIAKAVGMYHGESPIRVAEERWGKSHPQFVQYIRAAVAGGGTGTGEWGAELAQLDTQYTGDFVEYLYSKTVFDQLPLRAVPSRIRVKGQDGAFIGYWTGESKAIAMSKADYSEVDLSPLKVAALTVISMELLEDSQPSAEMLVRDGLAEASAQRIDMTFLSATAATPGVSPAGIKYNVSAITPSGNDLAAFYNDLQALLSPFVTGKMASGIQLIMNPASGMGIGMLRGTLDQRPFATISENGGSVDGRVVYVGDNVTAGDIIAIRSADVWKIGDSGIRVSMSKEATIEQSDAPTGATDTPVAQSAYPTNMFQEESVAFKVTRRINWQKRRSTAVTYISGADYGPTGS